MFTKFVYPPRNKFKGVPKCRSWWRVPKNIYALPVAAGPISTMVMSMVSPSTKIRGRPSLSLRAWRCNDARLISKFGIFTIFHVFKGKQCIFKGKQEKMCQKHPKNADLQHPPLANFCPGHFFSQNMVPIS